MNPEWCSGSGFWCNEVHVLQLWHCSQLPCLTQNMATKEIIYLNVPIHLSGLVPSNPLAATTIYLFNCVKRSISSSAGQDLSWEKKTETVSDLSREERVTFSENNQSSEIEITCFNYIHSTQSCSVDWKLTIAKDFSCPDCRLTNWRLK